MAEWAVVLVPFIRSCLDTNMFNSILIRVKITIFYNCVLDIREAFARELLQMYKENSFHSTKFSTDRGYATSLDMNIYLWKEDIEDGESVMTAKYRPVEYGKEYDVVNNPDKFQLYIDGKKCRRITR